MKMGVRVAHILLVMVAATAGGAVRADEPLLRPIPSRIDVAVGTPAVIPVEVVGRPTPTLRMEDGRHVESGVFWITRSPGAVGEAATWLSPAGVWTAARADQIKDEPTGDGFWVLVAQLPPDAIGQGVWINGTHTRLRWLPDPALLLREVVEKSASAEQPWSLPIDGSRLESASLLQLSEPARRDPFGRWRYRLMSTGLEPDAEPYLPGLEGLVEPEGSFDDPVIEALARQTEAWWRVGLAWLWGEDPALAERLKRRLVRTVDLGDGMIVPAWPTDKLQIDRLLEDLLDPDLPEDRRRLRVENFLVVQPRATAWIDDDRGRTDTVSDAPLSTLGVANLSEIAALCWATADGSAQSPELSPLQPGTAQTLMVRAPRAVSSLPRSVSVHAGDWFLLLPVHSSPLGVGPPGMPIGPLLHDWVIDAWTSGNERRRSRPDPVWSTAALLQREPDPEDRTRQRWVIVLECRRPIEAAPTTTEIVRIWLGPYGHPRAVLRVTSDGRIADELLGQTLGAQAGVIASGDRWVVSIPVPARAIDDTGELLIGITRTDGFGRRTAWPRRMFPWQTEPGRVGVDLSTWDPLD